MKTTLLAVIAVAAITGVATAEPIPAPADQLRFQGIWKLAGGDHSTVKTTVGKLPPMRPEARARYDAAVAARKAGKPTGDTAETCLPPGLPRAIFYPQPFHLIVEPNQVTFLHEYMHLHRLVFIQDALPANDDLDQNWLGFSAGRWDKGALVVRSRGFNDKTTIDTAGIPHSTELMLTERLRLVDKDTLEDVITIDDPKTFTSPWQTKITFQRLPDDTEIGEYICTLTNPEAVKK